MLDCKSGSCLYDLDFNTTIRLNLFGFPAWRYSLSTAFIHVKGWPYFLDLLANKGGGADADGRRRRRWVPTIHGRLHSSLSAHCPLHDRSLDSTVADALLCDLISQSDSHSLDTVRSSKSGFREDEEDEDLAKSLEVVTPQRLRALLVILFLIFCTLLEHSWLLNYWQVSDAQAAPFHPPEAQAGLDLLRRLRHRT